MADSVNGAITDAVTQANVKVLGDAPAQALGMLYQSIGQSLALAAGNAVTMQQQGNLIHQSTTTVGTTALYSLGTAAVGKAADSAAGGDDKPQG